MRRTHARAAAARSCASRIALALAVVAAAATGACRREFSVPGADTPALASAREVAVEPSEGCRTNAQHPVIEGVRRTLVVAGDERSYLIDAAAGAADRPQTIVLSFHGFGSTARQQRWWTGMGTLARREGFIAVHPEGHEGVQLLGTTGRGWDWRANETVDLAFVTALLDALERERCIDRRRVFATGMSNGGFFANLLGCRLAERIAAIAPVAGAAALPGCTPSRPVPVLLVYGRADRVVKPKLLESARVWWAGNDGCGEPRMRDGCSHYEGCRADLVYCEGSHGHTWPRDTSELIWRFFEAHPRP